MLGGWLRFRCLCFWLLTFFTSLVMLSLLSGLCSVCFIMCAFCGLHEGHFYMRTAPLLAPVSTMGKSRLVVVAVQGAPQVKVFGTQLLDF